MIVDVNILLNHVDMTVVYAHLQWGKATLSNTASTMNYNVYMQDRYPNLSTTSYSLYH